MAVKSIIEIDVQDEAFKNFQAAFEKYQAELKLTPKEWAKTGKESKIVDDNVKKIAENMAKFHNSTVATGHAFTSLARTSATIAGNILSATTQLLKWSGITAAAGGLVGAGGLWGISNLAGNSGNLRFNSMGVGVSGGAYQAANVGYQAMLSNPGATLGAINAARNNPAMSRVFSGISTYGKTNEELMGPIMLQAQDMAKRAGDNLGPMSSATGFDQIFSLEDLTRLKAMSREDVTGYIEKEGRRKEKYSLPDETLKKWQDFNIVVDDSKTSIENAFIKGLSPLAPELEKLSDSLSTTITNLLKSDGFKGAIDNITEWLNKGSIESSFSKAEASVKDFAETVRYWTDYFGITKSNEWDDSSKINDSLFDETSKAQEIQKILGYVSPIKNLEASKNFWGHVEEKGISAYDWAKKKVIESDFVNSGIKNNNPGNIRDWPGTIKKDGFAVFSSIEDGMKAAAKNLEAYQDKHGINTLSGILHRWAPTGDGTNNPDNYTKYMAQATGLGANEMLDLHNKTIQAKILKNLTRFEHGREAVSEKQTYDMLNKSSAQTVIRIENNTGGNAHVIAAQVAQ
jgi:hypothetical protein